jgi:hypothetical protein
MFYYVFLFTEKSLDVAPPRASVNKLMHMGKSFDTNPMNATNLAKANYINQHQINQGCERTPRRSKKTPKKSSTRRHNHRSHRRSRSRHQHRSRSSSPSDLEESFAGMDIESENSSIESRNYRRSKRRNRDAKSKDEKSETDSVLRTKTKGKMTKVFKHLSDAVDDMERSEMKRVQKEVEKQLEQERQERAARMAQLVPPLIGSNVVPRDVQVSEDDNISLFSRSGRSERRSVAKNNKLDFPRRSARSINSRNTTNAL